MRDEDELVRVIPINGEIDVCVVTKNGRLMRFDPDEVREMGRVASGVRGIRLKEGDKVVSCVVAHNDHQLLLVSSEGFGKRTTFESFNSKHRGGQGVTAMKMREGRGEIVRGLTVLPDDEVMLIASNGVIIRIAVNDVSVQGPHASGVRVMSVPDENRVQAVTLVREPEGDDEDEDEGEGEGEGDSNPGTDVVAALVDNVDEMAQADNDPEASSDDAD